MYIITKLATAVYELCQKMFDVKVALEACRVMRC
jgi:hypothetical protein